MEIDKIYLGDSYKLIKEIPDNSVDLVIIDPPYHVVGGGCMTGIFKDRGKRYFDAIENKNLTENYDISILDDLVRIMKKINIYIWGNKNQIYQTLHYFKDKDCLFEIIIWKKTNPTPFLNNQWLNDKEYCMFFRERGVFLGGNYETKQTVLESSANVSDKKLFEHPTIKPLEYIKNFIINSSQENDVVLDCFSGSGTTCVAAKELGRHYIGIEIDPKYHKISVDRLNGITANGQTSIFTNFDSME